jgi:MFS family permease
VRRARGGGGGGVGGGGGAGAKRQRLRLGPRPLVLLGATLLMCLTHLLLSLGSPALLYPASVLGGVGYGALNALFPTILSEVFGLGHMGAVYTTLSITLALGSYVLATVLVGAVYDAHNDAPTVGGKQGDCTALACFHSTYLVCAGLCLASSLGVWQLARCTARKYEQLYC